jgi:hypothetical protein
VTAIEDNQNEPAVDTLVAIPGRRRQPPYAMVEDSSINLWLRSPAIAGRRPRHPRRTSRCHHHAVAILGRHDKRWADGRRHLQEANSFDPRPPVQQPPRYLDKVSDQLIVIAILGRHDWQPPQYEPQ